MIKQKTTKNEETKTLEFLWQFNEIDKFFDKILWTEKFLTYNEKIKEIISEDFNISNFIKTHKDKLKYFWEVRNHITHWIKIDWHTYIYPTKHALSQINKYKKIIITPPLAKDFFNKNPIVCNNTDSLQKILRKMKKYNYIHVLVYDKNKFIWILSENNILDWISEDINTIRNIKDIKIKDLMFMNKDKYKCINNKEDVHKIEDIFSKNNQLEVLLVKKDENIIWIIAKQDLVNIENHIL